MATLEREPTGVYCVGCGGDLISRSTERRNLQSSASEHVATVWKALYSNTLWTRKGQGSDIDADVIVSGGEDPARGGRMCRKCFTAYAKVTTVQLEERSWCVILHIEFQCKKTKKLPLPRLFFICLPILIDIIAPKGLYCGPCPRRVVRGHRHYMT